MTEKLDEQDTTILLNRIAARASILGARVGDWCRMPDDDIWRRFTHDWGDSLQTTLPHQGGGSFYFSGSGHLDYSGGLDPALPINRLHDTGETLPARAWFFHHNHHRAHNGVDVMVPCRVFEFR